MTETIIADRIRELRHRFGMTQEELAENAHLSLAVIKKIEQGGNARMETLHKIARVFGVVTVTFTAAASPEPQEATLDDVVLAEMRAAIHPLPITFTGPLYGLTEAGAPDLAQLHEAVQKASAFYHAGRYDDLASAAPALVRSAHYHVEAFDSGDDHREALRLRADITGIAGRYLIQVRAHDLAITALSNSVRDAMEIGDAPLAAASIATQAWAMIRQGRFGEVEDLCAKVAEEIEPKMSESASGQLASWGRLLTKAAAAAVRNNRVDEAREYATVARAAGTRMERERHGMPGHTSFGPIEAGVLGPEIEMLADDPDRAIRLAERIPRDVGRASAGTWNRHRLTLAHAQVRTGNADKATEIMTALRQRHPEWLRYQQYARDIVREILAARQRIPTEQQRHLADFMNVQG